MKHALTALLASLALTVAAACGSDDTSSDSASSTSATTQATDTASSSETTAGNKYPDQVRETFIDSCTAAGSATRKTCECALDKVEKTVSFEEFKKADAEVRKDPEASNPVMKKLVKAAQTCVTS